MIFSPAACSGVSWFCDKDILESKIDVYTQIPIPYSRDNTTNYLPGRPQSDLDKIKYSGASGKVMDRRPQSDLDNIKYRGSSGKVMGGRPQINPFDQDGTIIINIETHCSDANRRS